jgi:uncharacterized protein GlcG (DUF336 family)
VAAVHIEDQVWPKSRGQAYREAGANIIFIEAPRCISEAAERIIKAAEAKAREMGKTMCIAVCDEDGTLKSFLRMNRAALLSVQIAPDKAFTAISFGGLATHEWYDFIKNDPPLLHGIVKTERLIVFGGGYAIKTAQGIIGGIGVSGGHYTEDMQVAEADLTAL